MLGCYSVWAFEFGFCIVTVVGCACGLQIVNFVVGLFWVDDGGG